jgi:hypothetical protein
MALRSRAALAGLSASMVGRRLVLVTATTALSCAVQVLAITMTTGRAHLHVGTSPAGSQAGRDVMAHLAGEVDDS